MKSSIRVISIIGAILALASPAIATTYVVPGDFSTIQAAIDAASDGDIIELLDGTFMGYGNRDRWGCYFAPQD